MFCFEKKFHEARVQIAGARAHEDAGGGREGHARVDAFTVADRRETRAVSEMTEDHFAVGSKAQFIIPLAHGAFIEPQELLHEILVRYAVEAVALHAECFVFARARKAASYARERGVEGGVEAGNLWDVRKAFAGQLD